MNNKTSKRIRRFALDKTVGMDLKVTRKYYQNLKLQYQNQSKTINEFLRIAK